MRAGLSSYTYTWAVGVPGYSPHRPLTLVQLLERAASLSVSVVQSRQPPAARGTRG